MSATMFHHIKHLSWNSSWVSALGVMALLSAPSLIWGQEKKQTDLPIKRVVMFSSGVAFFEHNGQVKDNTQVDLQFNTRDINDLLKSMVLQDLDNGRISSVTYTSQEPIIKTLQTFAVDLTQNPTLGQILNQLRGEQIEVEGPNKIVGTILGVETKNRRVGDDIVQVEMINLLTDTGLRSISLDNVTRIKLINEKLDNELRQALQVLALGHATDKKTVSLNFTGKGDRAVRVGYIQEAPVWKTSYRMVLKDGDAPFLQGWAIVENTTENDWKDVNLTLISGRPISFRMDLYQPLYVNRPMVEMELYASLRPQTYGQDLANAEAQFKGMAEKAKEMERADRSGALADSKADGLYRARQSGAGFAAPAAPPRPNAGFDLQQGVQSISQASDVGELFQYTIDTPVTLPRQQSAMLPIVNGSVKGEKVSIYNESVQTKHPLNGLKLTNSTELHLMQGPITVFDGGAYAGDARIEDLAPNASRLISYAMDLDTEVAPTSKSAPEELTKVRIINGTLEAIRKYVRTKTYVVKNSGSKVKKVLVEHPLDSSWTLKSPKEEEKTRDRYRFAINAEPGKPAEVAVVEEHISTQRYGLSNLDDDSIRIYISASVVSQNVKDALAEIIKRKREIQDLVNQRNQLQNKITIIDQEQSRIRQNMAQLPRGGDLYNRYVSKFGEQETEIENLREKIASLQTQENGLRGSLNTYLQKLNLD